MQNGRSSEAVHEYKKVEFNPGVIPPDAPEGEWDAILCPGQTSVKPIQSGAAAGYPRITFQLRLDSAADENNATFVGATLPFSIDIVSDADGSVPSWLKRRSKMTLRALANACGFDLDIVPNTVNGAADLQPLIDAAEGNTFTMWTTVRPGKGEYAGRQFVDVNLTKPGALYASGSASTLSDNEEGEEDEPSRKPTKKGNKR